MSLYFHYSLKNEAIKEYGHLSCFHNDLISMVFNVEAYNVCPLIGFGDVSSLHLILKLILAFSIGIIRNNDKSLELAVTFDLNNWLTLCRGSSAGRLFTVLNISHTQNDDESYLVTLHGWTLLESCWLF